jgi:neutral/alkaline ceramidase-like enzyme
MKVGAASAEITPELGLTMDGYEARKGGASGVHDPLMVRVLVAEGPDATVALVVADLLQVDPPLQELVAEEVLRRTGIPRERLQLVGTHTHSGPRLDAAAYDELRRIGTTIADAVEAAWRARREGVAAVGIGEVTGIGANRRPNGGPVDDRVTVTRFDAADGAPIATMVNYGCHPTTLGPNNTLYSADYPGVACRAIEAAVGGTAIFTTGPQGDVNPGGYSPEGSMVGVVVPWRTFESAERYGRLVADCAIDVWGTLRPAPSDRVSGDSRVVELERKDLPEAAAARQAATATARAEADVREAALSEDAIYHAAVAAAYADMLAVQAADPERDGPVRVRVSALALGPLLHCGVQGELFVELGQRIRSGLGEDATAIAALCDGTIGYIPTADAYEIGGYEPNASVLRAGEGERLAAAVVELARPMAGTATLTK